MSPSHPHLAAERTALYRLYDDGERLLYIGITTKPTYRFSQHSQSQPWWFQVTRHTLEWFDSRAEAEAAERDAIRAEVPRWNRQHMPGEEPSDRFRQAVAEYQEAKEAKAQARQEFHAAILDDLANGVRQTDIVRATGLTRERIRQIVTADKKKREVSQ